MWPGPAAHPGVRLKCIAPPHETLRRLAAAFCDWGIPTAESLRLVCAARDEVGQAQAPVFASGGIRTGQDIAKCVALGADLVGLASPFLKRAVQSAEAVVEEMDLLIAELRIAMFCCGAATVEAMRQPGVLSPREGTIIVFSSELSSFIGVWLPQIESEMHAVVDIGDDTVTAHYGMMQYHLGWADEQFQPFSSPTGKRLRPILCLVACAEVGGDPAQAMPAAAAIELLHNFSLVHDDVEDGDELRRHRPTVWKLWGVPQAINAGDGMFSLAFAAVQRLRRRGVTDASVHGCA